MRALDSTTLQSRFYKTHSPLFECASLFGAPGDVNILESYLRRSIEVRIKSLFLSFNAVASSRHSGLEKGSISAVFRKPSLSLLSLKPPRFNNGNSKWIYELNNAGPRGS